MKQCVRRRLVAAASLPLLLLGDAVAVAAAAAFTPTNQRLSSSSPLPLSLAFVSHSRHDSTLQKSRPSSPTTILQSHSSSATSATAASKSLKFKNFDGMLDAFRHEPNVVLYFTSVTCGPCKLQTKELSTVQQLLQQASLEGDNLNGDAMNANSNESNAATAATTALKVLTIDTVRFPHVGSRYDIGKLPCLLFLKEGNVTLRLEGLTKAEDVVEHFYKVNA